MHPCEPKWHDKRGASTKTSHHMSESTYMSSLDKWLIVKPLHPPNERTGATFEVGLKVAEPVMDMSFQLTHTQVSKSCPLT